MKPHPPASRRELIRDTCLVLIAIGILGLTFWAGYTVVQKLAAAL